MFRKTIFSNHSAQSREKQSLTLESLSVGGEVAAGLAAADTPFGVALPFTCKQSLFIFSDYSFRPFTSFNYNIKKNYWRQVWVRVVGRALLLLPSSLPQWVSEGRAQPEWALPSLVEEALLQPQCSAAWAPVQQGLQLQLHWRRPSSWASLAPHPRSAKYCLW